ncbi:MAG TPA: MotA/TolQ/ExbB proton channel family protein [Spirochaetota bacterium]|nr:MotA/TolQ/ExbB proton channel family protein [Spirochaetota bacterium]HRU65989.1 MotA/TolQ/ExbB proton channel family protein [Spirochaetota bacterium]
MLTLFQKGGPVMWPILICSVMALAIFIERFYIIYRANNRIRNSFANIKISKTLTQQCNNSLASDMSAFLTGEESLHEAEHKLFRFATLFVRDLELRLNWLAIIGNITPLLGLLGTVTGMIKVFMSIQNMHGQVNPSALAGGIWEALITTAAGLTVAIPSVIAYHYFEDRIDSITGDIKEIINQILETLKK